MVGVNGVEDEEEKSGAGQVEREPAEEEEPHEALDPLRRKCFSAPTEETYDAAE